MKRFLADCFRMFKVAPPKKFPNSGFQILQGPNKLEEENWEWYNSDTFYPVHIGEVFHSRYQVLGKLGYGAHSTAWLCRDLRSRKYLAMKVCERNSTSAHRELAAYTHLQHIKSRHAGASLIRHLVASFQVDVTNGSHVCLLHEPLGISLETLRRLLPNGQLTESLLKVVVKHLLLALDFMHTEGHMTHTDLQASNIHFGINDQSILQDFEDAEFKEPSARKFGERSTIYASRGLKMPKTMGRPILCDLSEARYGQTYFLDDIQPYVYRAPEVMLDIPWSCSTDIWNLGVLIWDLFENEHLFLARRKTDERSIENHLAEMIAILGLPPLSFLNRSKTSWLYFDASGGWKNTACIPDITMESSEKRLGGESQALFLSFIRNMVCWLPEERLSARDLLEHPWLQS